MPETTIYVRGTREDIRRRISLLPLILAGRVSDEAGIARGFMARIAYTFLEKVKLAFIVKSRGGTDEAGITWPKLTKEYLAYGRRFGPGEQTALKAAAGLGRGHRHAPGDKNGLLSASQLRQWRQIYARNLAWLSARESLGEAKGHAAAIAWSEMKKRGAQTKLDVFGSRQVDIGRDTGILFNSLSPGELSESGPDANLAAASEHQIIEFRPGEAIVGTNVPYAGPFHRRRPLWPSVLPQSWVDAMARRASEGLAMAVQIIVGGRAA